MKFPWYWPKWQHDMWAKIHAKGKKSFMIKGGAFWGILMYLVMALIPQVIKLLNGEVLSAKIILLPILIWSIAGWTYGTLTWWMSEKFYLKYEGNKSSGEGIEPNDK